MFSSRHPLAMARFGGDAPPSEPGGSSAPPGVFDLSDSGLSEFPARGAVKDLRYARELDLQGNALTVLPEGRLPRLEWLESLALTGNRLARLPDDLARCDRLRVIFAGANDIVDPAPAFEVPVLLHLGLAHNRVACLPPADVCSGAETLVSLDLAANALCGLRDTLESLAAMPSLRALVLRGNPLALEPGYCLAVLKKLPFLRTLDEREVSRAERAAAAERAEAEPAPTTTPTTVRFEVRIDALAVEPDPPPAVPDETNPVVDRTDAGADGEADAAAGDEPAAGDDAGGAGEENGDADVDGDGEASARKDECEFWVRVRLPEEILETPRVGRAPPVAEVGDATGDGDAAGDEPAAGDGDGDGDGDETAPETPRPFFARRVVASVSAATRDAFAEGLVFELWRREPLVEEAGSESDACGNAASGEVGEAAGTADAEEAEGNPRGAEAAEAPSEARAEGEKDEPHAREGPAGEEAREPTPRGESDRFGPTEEGGPPDDPVRTVPFREILAGAATVRLPSFVDGDDDASAFSRSDRLAFLPKPPLFSSPRAGAETGPLVSLADAPEQNPVGFATITCTLHVREARVDAAERTSEGETAEGEAAGGEADGARDAR